MSNELKRAIQDIEIPLNMSGVFKCIPVNGIQVEMVCNWKGIGITSYIKDVGGSVATASMKKISGKADELEIKSTLEINAQNFDRNETFIAACILKAKAMVLVSLLLEKALQSTGVINAINSMFKEKEENKLKEQAKKRDDHNAKIEAKNSNFNKEYRLITPKEADELLNALPMQAKLNFPAHESFSIKRFNTKTGLHELKKISVKIKHGLNHWGYGTNLGERAHPAFIKEELELAYIKR